jgi:radical SAM modification target selenobiotic family peptide
MQADELKKILATLCIASLISGSALTLSGCAGKGAKGGQKGSSASSHSG